MMMMKDYYEDNDRCYKINRYGDIMNRNIER